MDVELEARVLNAMCNYDDCLTEGLSSIKPEHFTLQEYKMLFGLIGKMCADGKAVSLVTVAMEAKPIFDEKRQSWLFVKDAFLSGAEFKYAVSRLDECSKTRKLNAVLATAYDMIREEKPSKDILAVLQDTVDSLELNTEKAKIITPTEHAMRMMDSAAERMERQSSGGIRTSFAALNRAINGGFQPEELIIVAAKTGKGKTAFAMNLMQDIAIVQKVPAMYVNTEMNAQQMDFRWGAMLCDNPNVTYEALATGSLNQTDFADYAASLEKMHISGFHSVTIPDLTMPEVVSFAKKAKAQAGIKFLVVDYVGRMDTSNADGKKEWEVLGGIAKQMKSLAQRLGITVIMLAQINEGGSLEGAKKMKNEADLFLEVGEITPEERGTLPPVINYKLTIGKNRNGVCVKIPVAFIGPKMRFYGEEKLPK